MDTDKKFPRLAGRAPAKLNLYLKIIRRRSDGWHELASLMTELPDFYDDVIIESAAEFSCRASDPALPQNLDNLAGRAAFAYAESARLEPDWHIEIAKRIPCGAGLGGGSSDAAQVLKLLNGFYRRLDGGELLALAQGIGADVPFFLGSGAAWAEGVGERLTELDAGAGLYAAVVKPLFDSITGEAYAGLDAGLFDKPASGVRERLEAALKAGDAASLAAEYRNDFAPGLEKKSPWYGKMREFFTGRNLPNFGITGSGSAGFVLSRDLDLLATAAADLPRRFPVAAIAVSRVGK